MAVVAAVAAVAAAVVGTVSEISAAKASADQDEALAKQAVGAARTEEFADRRRSTQVIAKQQAGASAAGLDIDSGTPLELMMDSAFNAELNALQIRKKGEMESTFYKNRARQSKGSIPGIAFQGLTKAITSIYGGGWNSGMGAFGSSAGAATKKP